MLYACCSTYIEKEPQTDGVLYIPSYRNLFERGGHSLLGSPIFIAHITASVYGDKEKMQLLYNTGTMISEPSGDINDAREVFMKKMRSMRPYIDTFNVEFIPSIKIVDVHSEIISEVQKLTGMRLHIFVNIPDENRVVEASMPEFSNDMKSRNIVEVQISYVRFM